VSVLDLPIAGAYADLYICVTVRRFGDATQVPTRKSLGDWLRDRRWDDASAMHGHPWLAVILFSEAPLPACRRRHDSAAYAFLADVHFRQLFETLRGCHHVQLVEQACASVLYGRRLEESPRLGNAWHVLLQLQLGCDNSECENSSCSADSAIASARRYFAVCCGYGVDQPDPGSPALTRIRTDRYLRCQAGRPLAASRDPLLISNLATTTCAGGRAHEFKA